MKAFSFMVVLAFSAYVYAENQAPSVDPLGAQTAAGGQVAQVAASPTAVRAVTDGAVKAFTSVIAVANKAIDSIAGNNSLKAYGKRLTLMLASIVIVWSIIKNIALKQSLSQLIGDMVFPMIITAFVLSAGLDVLPGVIKSTANSVAGLFGAGSAGGMEMSLASSMFNAMEKVWDAKSDSPLGFLNAPLDTVAILILRIGIIIIMLLAVALGVAAILVAKFQMALAIGLAGLFIPWILFKPTEFLFSGWLNFFLKAGFGLVGVFAVATVTLAGAKGMAALITETNADIAGVLTFAAMGAMSVVFAYLMLKGSDIGEGLIGGSATGIGQLSSVAKGAAAMSAPRMAGALAGTAGSAARGGASAAAGKMLGPGELSGAGKLVKAAVAGRSPVRNAAFDASRGRSPESVAAASSKTSAFNATQAAAGRAASSKSAADSARTRVF